MRRGAEDFATGLFGAPGEALQYDSGAQFAADVAGGVGSVGTFLVPGGVARLAGAGRGLAGAERAAEVARAARPGQYVIGTGQGLEQGIQDVEATEARTGEEISAPRAFAAYLLNAGLGATEVGVAARLFERIPVAQRGAAAETVANLVRRATAGRVDPTEIGQAVGRTLTGIERSALGRVAVRGTEEALQEGGVQLGTNIIARGLYDSERDVTEGVGYAALVGGTVGAGVRGGVETTQRVLRPRAGAAEATALAADPAIRAEFQRLADQEAATIMQAAPGTSLNDAAAQVSERAEELLTRAAANVAVAKGETDVTPDAGAGLDVSGGVGAGVAPALGPAQIATGTPELGAPVSGRLEEPVPSVPVPADVPGARDAPLASGDPAVRQVLSGVLQDMPDNFTEQQQRAAMAAAEYTLSGAAFDTAPLANLDVDTQTAVDYGASKANELLAATQVIPAPTTTSGPSIDAAAVAPVKAAITAAAAPAVGPVPTLGETAARTVGIAPTPPAEPLAPTITSAAPVSLEEAEAVLRAEANKNPNNRKGLPAALKGLRAGFKGEPIGATLSGPNAAAYQAGFDLGSAVRQNNEAKAKLAGLESAAAAAPATAPIAPAAPTPTALPAAPDYIVENARGTVDALRQSRPDVLKQVTDLHADDFTAGEIAQQTGLSPETVRDIRLGLGLPGQGKPSGSLMATTSVGSVQERAAFEAWRDNYKTTGQVTPAPEVAAPEGGTEPLTPANVDAAVSVKLTKAQINRLERAAGIQRMKLNGMQKRIARSRSAEETMSLAGKLMLATRKPGDSVGILTSLFNSTPPPLLQALMAPLETADVVRLGESAGMENVTRIDNMVRNEYTPYIYRIMARASKLTEKWADFTSRSPKGADAMGDVMYFSVMIDADPSLAPTAAEYLKIDPEFQAISAKLAAETDPKKKRTTKGQLTKREGEIQRLYFGGADPDGGAKVSGWNDVPPEGKQLFREARDYYRADFQEHYRLLMQRIDDAQFEDDDAARLKTAVDDMFKEASKRAIYFPLKRFGDYWVSVGTGKSGEFYMFESASAQDAFIERLRSEGETREIDYSKGRDTLRLGLRNKTTDASSALKGILGLLDGKGIGDVDVLKDHIFQMYLTALPEADMRRRFIHRQFKTGFSTDALRTFVSTAVSSAYQLGRLAYEYKFKNLIDQSYAETALDTSKRRLDTITRELGMRLKSTMSSGPEGVWDKAANFGAKATFLFILSSPKSAFMNLTQLHFVGLPTLFAEFGEAATLSMAARYTGQMLTGKRVANPFRDEDGNLQMQMPEFTTEGSAYINGLREKDPDRYEAIQKAWEYAREREVTESTFSSAANVYERTDKPTTEVSFTQAARQGNAALAVQRATANAVNGMGALFHHSERIGREIMYMSAFELAYDRALAQGKTPAEATEIAMPKAAEMTNKGMFDFSNWNKSRAAKTPVGKVALQMRAYSFSMTSLLFRSAANMVAFNRTGAERLAAARVFMGVGAITTLYGGFRTSQFYLLGQLAFGLYKMVESALAGDDEEEEIEQGYLNPETIDRELMKYADEQGRELTKKDWDYYIRTVWIPETLGRGGTLQEALGFSDETADKLATAADIGIPGIFGVDISNSVSLTNLWHPVDTKADRPDVQLFEAVGRGLLGPSGSLLSAPVKFYMEFNAGNLDRAIESIMPAFLRGYVKAERLKDEGLVVGRNRDVVLRDPSFYDAYTLTMQALGFPEAETSRAMQLDIRAGEIEREIAGERTELLDRRYRAILDTATDTSDAASRALRKVERDIEIYNLNYPSNAIGEDTKERSFLQKAQEAAERMYGLGVNSNIPIRQPLLEERVSELGR
jgi:hypothetical protein